MHEQEIIERVNNWISNVYEGEKSPHRKQLIDLWWFLQEFNSPCSPLIYGVLLYLVREAWGDPLAIVQNERDTDCPTKGWVVIIFGRYISSGETEEEALVEALELSLRKIN